jgi:hypothetical protein
MNKLSLVSILILLLCGCEKPTETRVSEQHSVSGTDISTTDKSSSLAETPIVEEKHTERLEESLAGRMEEKLPVATFMLAEWTDLIPKDDLDALLNPPAYIDEIVENSAEDQLNNKLNNLVEATNKDVKDTAYHRALASTSVVDAVNNVAIRLPAYIVPLEFDDEQRVTQFFMVPFFGACIHLPPPPPNQTIFVNYSQGFTLESIYEPYWVSGIIKNSLVENDTAIAAYTMEVHALDIYTDE